jgi:hypothetical protein
MPPRPGCYPRQMKDHWVYLKEECSDAFLEHFRIEYMEEEI